MIEPEVTRRDVLTAGIAAVATLAGCADGPAPKSQPPEAMTPTVTESTSMSTSAPTDEATKGELDLREANVTEVSLQKTGTMDYRFDVTLYHDDDGEDGYANWWQVETLDGDRLGRRELLHAHSTARFTRSETIAVPSDVDCVVVRGHDQTHGYGGQAMLVTVETGATRAVEQGSEKQSMAGQSCR